MPDRDEFLVVANRLTGAFRTIIAIDGDGSNRWLNDPEICEHYVLSVYLIASIAYLEGAYGKFSWRATGFDNFIESHDRLKDRGMSAARMDALYCIRNACTHNARDLAENTDKDSLQKVIDADLPGVVLNGSVVKLTKVDEVAFIEFVRIATVAIARFHGDG
jgi:hypothetical protein